ncbi:MAG: PQQ-dependent sugar dehydrogenase [Paracoccaceae bacterium]
MIRILTLCFACSLPMSVQAQGLEHLHLASEFKPAFKFQTKAPKIRRRERLDVETVATGLAHPWGIAVLPDGGYLVTEREGRLNYVTGDGRISRIDGLPAIEAFGQGGLLDVALADDFDNSRRVFLTYSKATGRGGVATAAASAVLSKDNARLTDVTDIFVQTPGVGSGSHFGSRIVVDGDIVFITTGDRGTEDQVQNPKSSIGKVIRLTSDGRVPADNPFVGRDDVLPEVYALGTRNAQGADIHPVTGALWTLEHGPRGGDELNLIQPGANYGWPVVSYGVNYNGSQIGEGIARAPGFVEPVYYWDPVIAPGDFTFYDGDLFEGWSGDVIAAALRGGLVRLTFDGDRVTAESRYLTELGRVRDVEVDRDGSLLVLTDDPNGGILRVTPG